MSAAPMTTRTRRPICQERTGAFSCGLATQQHHQRPRTPGGHRPAERVGLSGSDRGSRGLRSRRTPTILILSYAVAPSHEGQGTPGPGWSHCCLPSDTSLRGAPSGSPCPATPVSPDLASQNCLSGVGQLRDGVDRRQRVYHPARTRFRRGIHPRRVLGGLSCTNANGKKNWSPCLIQNIARPGACRKTPSSPQNGRPWASLRGMDLLPASPELALRAHVANRRKSTHNQWGIHTCTT